MTLNKVTTYLEQVRKDLRLPGLSVAIVHNGKIIHTDGLGSAGLGLKMTAKTPMIIGSLSKSFTAFVIMQLVEQGRIKLDTSVQEYIPWFLLDDGRDALITVRHLLTHSSGLSRRVGRDLLCGNGDITIEESVRSLSTEVLVSDPGKRFKYSNANYLILSLIIELRGGIAEWEYQDYIKDLFKKLQMNNSFVDEGKAWSHGMSVGYRWCFGCPVPYDADSPTDMQGAAFLISSAEDLAKWMIFHLDKSDNALVSAEGMKTLHEPYIKTNKGRFHYAMGWRVEQLAGLQVVRHGGEVSNYRSDIIMMPKHKIGVVVLTNCNNGLVANLGLDKIADNVVRILLDQPVMQKWLTFKKFYWIANSAMALITIVPFILFFAIDVPSGQTPTLLPVIQMLATSIISGYVLYEVPRRADMSWQGLEMYVPDISRWIQFICHSIFILNAFIVIWWIIVDLS